MKKLIFNALAVICMGVNCNAQTQQIVIVNGDELKGKSVMSMTFEGDDARLSLSDNSTITVKMEEVRIFFDSDNTGIEENKIKVFNYNGIVDDYLTLSGISTKTTIAIYDAAGKLLTQARTENDATSIYVGNLCKGVYTAKAGKYVIKFVKK